MGTLVFTSAATPTSLAGSYAIDGSGLSAANYTFVQDPASATALTITGSNNAPPPIQLRSFTSSIQPPPPPSSPQPGLIDNLNPGQFSFLPRVRAAPPPPPPPPAPPPPVSSPLAGNNAEQPISSDDTTEKVAGSLDGGNAPAKTPASPGQNESFLIPGLLTNTPTRLYPPTDVSAFPSLGNSSLWQ
jgi:hypothetical protein